MPVNSIYDFHAIFNSIYHPPYEQVLPRSRVCDTCNVSDNLKYGFPGSKLHCPGCHYCSTKRRHVTQTTQTWRRPSRSLSLASRPVVLPMYDRLVFLRKMSNKENEYLVRSTTNWNTPALPGGVGKKARWSHCYYIILERSASVPVVPALLCNLGKDICLCTNKPASEFFRWDYIHLPRTLANKSF